MKPSRPASRALDDLLGEALRDPALEPAEPGDHPSDLELAAYLDRTGDPEARDRLEAHLASCPACREIVGVVALHLEAETGRETSSDPTSVAPLQWSPRLQWNPRPSGEKEGRRRPARRLLALAAAAILGLGLLFLWSPIGPGPGQQDGGWPPAGFETFVGDVEATRRAPAGAELELLHPRFEHLETARPTFRWRSEGGRGALVRLLIVDSEERLVGRSEIAGDSRALADRGESVFEVAYPPELPALEPGELYAWKIDVRSGEGPWWSSGFAPFRISASAPRGP